MKNYIKRVIAFIRGIVAGALLYELFARPVLMDFIKEEFNYKPKFHTYDTRWRVNTGGPYADDDE